MTATPAKGRTVKAAQPIPSSIPMPDSAVRSKWWYQIYVRLARPTLDWVGVAGAAWSLFVGDWWGNPMADGTRIIVLGFVAALYGIRTVEKAKGVA
jgi:hypothetical protein